MKKHRLNRTTIFLSAISAVVLLTHSGCTKDYIPEMVTQKGFAVNLMISSDSEVSTKSDANTAANTAERYINSGYVFVFDRTTGEQVSSHELNTAAGGDIAENTNGTAKPKITAPIKVSNGDRVVFVLNSALTGDIGDVTYANLDEKFRLDNGGFETPSANGTGGLPMYGEMMWDTSEGKTVTVHRAVAKIQVKLPVNGLVAGDDFTGSFNTTNVTYKVYQQAVNGNVTALFKVDTPSESKINSVGITAPAPTFSETEIALIDNPLSLINTTDNYTGASYIYEHKYSDKTTPDTRLAILLKHKNGDIYKYYRLDLMNQAKAVNNGVATYLDVERNHHYKIEIKKVKSHGYDTPDEAMKNTASNIEYEITDDGGDHTVSNGQYAISVDKELYANGTVEQTGSTPITIANGLKYILPTGAVAPSESTNTITCVNATTHDPISGITVTPAKLTTTDQSIALAFADKYKRYENVAFKVTYGNLSYVSAPITVTPPPPLEISSDATANSYMIPLLPPGGVRLSFPAIKRVNEYHKSGAGVIGSTTEWYAEVIWADFNPVLGGATPVTITQAGAVNDVYGTGVTEKLEVILPNLGKGGNVTIGIKKKDGADYLWSWHIWITDYAPQPVTSDWALDKAYPVTGGQVHSYSGTTWSGIYKNKVIMDRNLGATVKVGDGAAINTKSGIIAYGMYYQNGRKDPFPHASGANTTIIQTWNKDGVAYPTTDVWIGTQGTGIPLSVKNPTKFNANDNALGPWADAPTAKSIHDPCPAGWRVPIKDTWRNFGNTSIFGPDFTSGINGGRTYKGAAEGKDVAAWYPASGLRESGSGVLYDVDSYGYSWSSSVSTTNGMYMFFYSTYVSPSYRYYRARGLPVRCMQE